MKLAVALMVALVSCGGGGGGESPGVVVCSSFANQPVTADTFANPCAVDAATADLLNMPVGEMFLAGTGRILCEDNRVLIWNDLGWGYEGQPFTAFDEGGVAGEYVAPKVERDRCAAT